MKEYDNFTIECKDQVATIRFLQPPRGKGNIHWELGCVFSELREDNGIRVIVMTGAGENFWIPGSKQARYDSPDWLNEHTDPSWAWHTFTGIVRLRQGMAEIEKPIVAKVNGDAIGFGASNVFSCDFILALEDAVIMDHHIGATFMGKYNGEIKVGGHEFSNVPGDGGTSLMPVYMSPCKAKEYLMLAKSYTGAELAQMGIINYALPASELDAKVDDMVQRLLQKGAYALARTKRLCNRKLVEHLNLTLDASVAYEMATTLQPLNIHKLG